MASSSKTSYAQLNQWDTSPGGDKPKWEDLNADNLNTDTKLQEHKTAIDGLAGSIHTPYIGENGNWYEWDVATSQFVDTGKTALGVCIGPSAPSDGYYVWIDTSGDPDTVVTSVDNIQPDANGAVDLGAEKASNKVTAIDGDSTDAQYPSAKCVYDAISQGAYELIETITVTEDTASIVRTQEPDGTPYAFKAIGVVVQAEVGSVNSGISVYGRYNSTLLQSGFISGAISNSIKKYGYAQIYPDWGAWTAIGSTSVNGLGWTVTQMTGYSPARAFSVKESENPYCTQVTLEVNTSGATIPTGTIIQIYGVRA